MTAKSEKKSPNSPNDITFTNGRSLSYYDLSDCGSGNPHSTKKSHNLKDMKQSSRKYKNQASGERLSSGESMAQLSHPSSNVASGKQGKSSRFGSLFHRGNSARAMTHTSSIMDLSYNENRPDVVKIFCEQVRKGLESKGVKVNRNTTAGEVLSEIMKLLSIPSEVANGYGLFDVVGSIDSSTLVARSMISLNEISEEHGTIFMESCRRRIHRNEPLLQLDSYWQPKIGLCRRFEIRPLSKEEQLSDEIHQGAPKELVRSPSGRRLIVKRQYLDKECQTDTPHGLLKSGESHKHAHIPLGPFLLLLRGFSTRDDRLYYELTYVNRIGGSENCDLRLYFTECPPLLCVIQIEEVKHSGDGMAYHIILQCKSIDNLITVNGERVLDSIILHPGDILNFVDRYLFLFKDITQVQDCNLRLQHIQRVPSTSSGVSTSSSKMLSRNSRRPHLQEELKKFPESLAPSNMSFLPVSGAVSNGLTNEILILCDVLHEILQLYSRDELSWRVAGCYIIGIMEYGDHHLGVDSSDIMKRSAKTYLDDIIKKHYETRDGMMFQHLMRVAVLLFEVHFFYQRLLETIPGEGYDSTQWFNNSEFFKTSTEDLMQVIFNGIIDNSALISISRAVLMEDPFRKNIVDNHNFDNQQKSGKNMQVTMENFFLLLNQIVNTFMSTTGPCVKHLMHHFIYLLFATITKCLVLHILTDDSLLRWECGIKIRSNLDQLQEWLNLQELREVDTSTHLLSSVVDLLSMSKTMLIGKSWIELRNLFSLVPPSLLNHLLQHYEGGQGIQTRLWKPDPEDNDELSYKANHAVESYYNNMAQPNDLFYEYNRPSIDLREVTREKSFDMGIRKLMSLIRTRQPRVDLREVLQVGMGYVMNNKPHQIQSTPTAQPYGYTTREDALEEIISSSSGGTSSRFYPESMPPNTDQYHRGQDKRRGVTKVPSYLSASPVQGTYQSNSLSPPASASNYPPQHSRPRKPIPPGNGKAPGPNLPPQSSNQLSELMRLSRSIQDIRARNLSRQNMLGSMNSLNYPSGENYDEENTPAPVPPAIGKRRPSRTHGRRVFTQEIDSSSSNTYYPKRPFSPATNFDIHDNDSRLVTTNRSTIQQNQRQNRMPVENGPQDPSIFDLNMPEDLHLSSDEGEITSIRTPSETFYADNVFEQTISNNPAQSRQKDRAQLSKSLAEEEVNYVDVLLKKENGSLGLGLIDASTTSLSRSGLFVKTIREGGPACKSQLLDVGDEIIKVNHHNILQMPHNEAMNLIKSTGRIVSLRVRKADALTRMHIENAMRAEH